MKAWQRLCLCFTCFTLSLNAQTRVIGGEVVDQEEWKEVVNIGGCTATVVGPRVIVTASHCVRPDATREVEIRGKTYTATQHRHPSYNPYGGAWGHSHDIAVLITTEEMTGVEPISISGDTGMDDSIMILGFGCIYPGGSGADGNLRLGYARVQQLSGTDMRLYGDATCFGDSGGPNMKMGEKRPMLVGINSKGNISNTSYNLRADLDTVRGFLENISDEHGVGICGVNLECK